MRVLALIAGVVLATTAAKSCESPSDQQSKRDKPAVNKLRHSLAAERRSLVHMRAGGSGFEKQITVELPGEGRHTFVHKGVWEQTYHNVPRGIVTLLVINLDPEKTTYVTCQITVDKRPSREISSRHLKLVRCQRNVPID